MITAEEARKITDKALDREKQEQEARVDSYVESISARVAKAAGRGERRVFVYFNLHISLWNKVFWRLAQVGFSAHYLKDTNEIEVWW